MQVRVHGYLLSAHGIGPRESKVVEAVVHEKERPKPHWKWHVVWVFRILVQSSSRSSSTGRGLGLRKISFLSLQETFELENDHRPLKIVYSMPVARLSEEASKVLRGSWGRGGGGGVGLSMLPWKFSKF